MLWICELELQAHTKGCVAQIMVLEPDLRDFGQGNQTSLCFWYPFQSEDDKSLYVLGFVSTIRIDNCLEWYLAHSRFHVNVTENFVSVFTSQSPTLAHLERDFRMNE